MRDALVYHIASGQAFFTGVLLIHLAMLTALRPKGRGMTLCRTVSACVGGILIAVSATPLSGGFYATAGIVSFAWLATEGSPPWAALRRSRPWLRCAVLAIWWLGMALELPFHLIPGLPRMGNPPVYVVGDSISAGMGGEAATWPKLLAREHGIVVHDLARAGATVASARQQAARVTEPGALVLAEIGGNDLLGATTPESFERGLNALLARLRSDHRTVVLLELPLPPFYNEFGAIQRRAARRHGVRLVPKRVLLGVLTTKDATLDSIHLSPSGHARMAETIWDVLRPAFGFGTAVRGVPKDRQVRPPLRPAGIIERGRSPDRRGPLCVPERTNRLDGGPALMARSPEGRMAFHSGERPRTWPPNRLDSSNTPVIASRRPSC